MPPLERRFPYIQTAIITNFVVVSSVGIKRVDCILNTSIGIGTIFLQIIGQVW